MNETLTPKNTEEVKSTLDTHSIAEEAMKTEGVVGGVSPKVERPKEDKKSSGFMSRISSLTNRIKDQLNSGEKEKQEKLMKRWDSPAFKSEYTKLMKENPDKAAKFKYAVENITQFVWSEADNNYMDKTKYSVASGEGTAGK
ncbi:MAG: hypothetical protein NTW62_00810 [Candidatus Nomurabacteria bacterium]|nr:hypothetical protein [Candidatus Nomurabacteria bacterium]